MQDLLAALEAQLADVMLADRRRLRQRLHRLRRAGGAEATAQAESLQAAIARSRAQRERREAARPRPTYADELPVSARRNDIAAAILAHQVVIVCGETGSGKTTQLPKICLELGRGVAGMIGHTQPRRIAARSVAQRIAEELASPLGEAVGYKVRFTDRVSPHSHIKLMTDGILLAEIQGDRYLEQYDTLIVDEAHERSLNIDFLLGYLKQLLPRRPDLKLIITSATIDPERFARHFGAAPVLEVSGRTYPVEVRYRPLQTEDEDERDRDLQQGIVAAVDELSGEGPGDVLVFLPGEREIRETAEALRKHHPPHTEILPLYARLSAAEQHRVFEPHGGRRIVLATNIAETSLTVPGIRYVVDSGYARISRYSHRSKVQRLPIEKIARAAADQRKGRCGRVSAGVCIRLYSEDDYAQRPAFTEPEILRTNLAGVILQMKALNLGAVERFPFLEPPDGRRVNDGYRLLHELGAVDAQRRLTELGRRLARLPLDPRIGRMLLAAAEQACLHEMLIIASALSVQDPRERPVEAQAQADEKHRAFVDERSDFLAYLKLWAFWQDGRKHLTHSKLRKHCREHFLSFMRLREWQDVHTQLTVLVKDMGFRIGAPLDHPDAVHRALLAGLLSQVAVKAEPGAQEAGRGRGREGPVRYTGARGASLYIHPGSALSRKPPQWIMAAELVETTRLFARTVAVIEPAWIEEHAAHLLKRSHSAPHWEKRAGQVVAYEQTTLYGLVITARRKVNYGPIAPEEARAIFIRDALVPGQLHSRGAFVAHNRRLIAEVEALEHKARRQDILVDAQRLVAFFDARVPTGVCSTAQFETWRKRAEREAPQLLFLAREDLMQHEAAAVTGDQFPDRLVCNGLPLALHYRFEPGHPEDGVSVDVPVAVLNQLQAPPFAWLVPGLLQEKVVALIKALPKSLRRHFVPAPDFARAVLQAVPFGEGALPEVLAAQLLRMTGVAVPPEAWDEGALPAHLRINFRVLDAEGRLLGMGRDLADLQGRLQAEARADFARLPPAGMERSGIVHWDFGELPATVEVQRQGLRLRAYPALVDETDSVALRLFDSPQGAEQAMRGGLRRLFMLALRDKVKYLRRHLPDIQTLCLYYSTVDSCASLTEDLVQRSVDRTCIAGHAVPRSQGEFERLCAAGASALVSNAAALAGEVGAALREYHVVAKRLRGSVSPQSLAAMGDIRSQLERLVYPHFVLHTSDPWLAHLPRYLRAIALRLDRLEQNPARDRQLALQLQPFWDAYLARSESGPQGAAEADLQEYRWLIEELRVSLFAQELKTSVPVSPARLRKEWAPLLA